MNTRHLILAKEMANQSDRLLSNNTRYAVGAVIAKGNTVLGTGKCKTDPKFIAVNRENDLDKQYYSLHAEICALLNTRKSVKGSTVYVYGFIRKSSRPVVSSRPCDNCRKILKEHGVRYMVYRERVGKSFEYNVVKERL